MNPRAYHLKYKLSRAWRTLIRYVSIAMQIYALIITVASWWLWPFIGNAMADLYGTACILYILRYGSHRALPFC